MGTASHGSTATSPLARLGRGFATLGIAELGARLIAFAATAWVSQVIGASQFGVVSFALAALLYANRVVSWELEAVGVVEVASTDAAGDRAAGTIIAARLACAIGVVLLIAGLARWVLPSPDGSVLLVYSIGLACIALNTRFVHLMRQAPGRPALARLLAEVVNAAIIVTIVRSAADVTRVPIGFVVGEGLAALFLLTGIRAWNGVREFDPTFALRTARRASPLVLSSLLGLVVFNLDLILLRFTRGAETAGYYAAAYAIASLLLNLGVTFYASVLPGLSRLREDATAFRELYVGASVLIFALLAPFVVGGVILARPLVHLVFGAAYAPSASPLVPLLIAAGLTLSRFVPLASVVALGRRREALWINGSGAIVNVVLNLILIPRFGMLGAAWAAVVTDLVRLSVALMLARRSGMSLAYIKRLARPAVAVTMMGLVAWLGREWPVLLTVALGGVTYLAALLALRVVRPGPGMRLRFEA